LVDSFADIDKGEAWLHQMDIGVYTQTHQRRRLRHRLVPETAALVIPAAR
jgi:hypothetical protein